jgi:isopenicillin-N N-acyltransferase-like protein
MRNIGVTFICLLLILPVTQANYLNTTRTEKQSSSHADVLNGGWLEERDNVTILHVNGSNYQMGYQHGYLLREKVQENIRAFLHFANSFISYDAFLAMWDSMIVYVPQEYKDELQGIADGANISFNDIAVSIAAIEYADHGCYGIAAWGPATVDGKLYHARSFDLPSTIQDPVTGRYAHENIVLVVRKPTNGFASLCPSIAGSCHTGGGINEHGIALGIQICWSKDQTF